MKKRVLFIVISLVCFLTLPGVSYAANRCVDIMGAIEDVKNKKKDIPSMIEDLKNIVFNSQTTQPERELAIKFLTTIAIKKEPYFQTILLILSDALLKNQVSQTLILKSWVSMTLQTTNRDLAYQSIDKWNEVIVKLNDPSFMVLALDSFKLCKKYPEKFLLTFQNLAKLVADHESKVLKKLFSFSKEDDFVYISMEAILALPEEYQKEIMIFLNNNVNDMQNSEALRQIYFKIYGEAANKALQQILD